jgi:hypothetical protein
VFHNRISGFRFAEETESAPVASNSAAFGAVPAFALAGGAGPSADIYRLAYQQAQQQVAARREQARTAHEWN